MAYDIGLLAMYKAKVQIRQNGVEVQRILRISTNRQELQRITIMHMCYGGRS